MVTCGMNALLVCCILFVQKPLSLRLLLQGWGLVQKRELFCNYVWELLKVYPWRTSSVPLSLYAMSTLNLVVGLKRRSDVSCIKVAAWRLASHHRNVKFNTGRLAEVSANHRSALSQAFFVARAWFFLTCRASFNIAIVADLKKDMVFRERLNARRQIRI